MKRKINHPFKFILTTRFKVRLVKKLLKNENTSKILDAGCGSGFILSQLDNIYDTAVGIDMSPEAIKFGQQFTKAELKKGNAEKMEFSDDEFACIISTDAIEHIPDDKAAMKEAYRVLKNSGCMIIYTPSEVGLLSNTSWAHLYHDSETSYLLDQRYYTIDSLSKLAEEAGFRIEYAGYHSVFFQEFFTQLFKWISSIMGKEYEHQGHIYRFTGSKLFTIYRWILLPIIVLLVRLDELLFETIFRGKVPGHRIVVKCRK